MNAGARQPLRLVLLVVVPIVVGLAILFLWLRGGRYVGTDNAYVEADKVAIGAEVAGTVQDVLVRDNEAVAVGQLLFRIDPAPFQVAVARAEANLAQARTNLRALQASYREKKVEIALARTRRAFADKDLARQRELAARNFVAATVLDAAQQDAELAAQQVTALEQDLERIAASLGGSVDTPIEEQPAWRVARAELDRARLDLAHTEVRAPSAGVVNEAPHAGQHLSAGGIALVLVLGGTPRVEANLTEKDLTWVREGQDVEVRVDTYPGTKWRGRVESLSPATGAEFSILPAQNATGNWVKIAQRVSVRIALAPAPGQPPLRSGLSAEVRIDTHHRRRLLGVAL